MSGLNLSALAVRERSVTLFLLVAMALLASEIPFVARFRDRIRARYPGPWREAERVSNWFRSRFGKGAHTGDEG